MLSLSLVQQFIFLRTGLSLGTELMTEQHNVLHFMEMLFLGSVLMIIIVKNHAWEPVSQIVPLITQQQYI